MHGSGLSDSVFVFDRNQVPQLFYYVLCGLQRKIPAVCELFMVETVSKKIYKYNKYSGVTQDYGTIFS
jgi:hypothetical protein